MAPTAESVAPRSGGGKVGKPGDYITLDEWATYSPERRQRFWEILREAPSRSAALNFQEGGSIEWALWSWNPVTGCLHNCPYCYARDIANRIYEPAFTPALWPARLDAPHNVKVPHDKIAAETDTARKLGLGNVFTCSMADLFGRWVPSEWIDAVLSVVRDCPQWNFLFLTKFPQRMADFRFPDNAWVGTTVDQQARVANAERAFRKIEAKVKWLSLEPLIEPLEFSDIGAFDWVVIGGASSSTQTPEWKPPRSWVNAIEDAAEKAGVMVYEKPNLLYTRRSYPGLEMIEPAEAPTALRYLPEAKWPAPG